MAAVLHLLHIVAPGGKPLAAGSANSTSPVLRADSPPTPARSALKSCDAGLASALAGAARSDFFFCVLAGRARLVGGALLGDQAALRVVELRIMQQADHLQVLFDDRAELGDD